MFHNYNEVLVSGLKQLFEEGKKIPSRNGETLELHNAILSIEQNRHRHTFLSSRKNNPIATIVETLWVLYGSVNAEWLSTYLPRALEYSDDGRTWSNGYGRSLRDWHGVDQIMEAYHELKKDPESRRCVIQINDPIRCLHKNLKDIACNLTLSFLIRDEALHLTVFSRSMDILWGSMVNMYEWSVLQELMASWLGIKPGVYTHLITSLHLYEPHYEVAEKIIEANEHKVYELRNIELPILGVSEDLEAFQVDSTIFNTYANTDPGKLIEHYEQEINELAEVSTWFHAAKVCTIVGYYLNVGKLNRAFEWVVKLPESYLRVSVIDYISNKYPEFEEVFNSIEFSENEMKLAEYLLREKD